MEGEVAVIGLGVMGAATLLCLAQRGVRVTGYEQFEPGHSFGSSHGESRIIRTAYFEDPRYVPLAQRAFDTWRKLAGDAGRDLLIPTGALSIGAPDSALVAGTLASAREHNLPHERLTATQIEQRFPAHRPSRGDVGIFEEAAGVLLAEPCVIALVDLAQRLGAEVSTGTRVESIVPGADNVRVHAGQAVREFSAVVVTVGPWLGTFVPDLQLPLQVTRQVLAWFPVPDPLLFRPACYPVFLHDVAGRVGYGFPSLDGETVKIAIHQEGLPTTAADVDREVHADDIRPIAQFIRTHLRGVEADLVRARVCMYTNTPDFHFILGRSPRSERVVLAGGFSGHGFKFAPIIGEAVADLATRGQTDIPIGHFALRRDALRSAAR